jgi:ribosomal protein L17
VRKRPGGFTRIVRLGQKRLGDDADMAVIELVDRVTAAPADA